MLIRSFFFRTTPLICAQRMTWVRATNQWLHSTCLFCFALLCFALLCFVLFCFVLFCFYINFNRHPFFLFSFVLPLIDNIVPPHQKIMCAPRAGAQAIKDDGCEKFPSFQYLKACITKFGCKKSRAELRAK